MESTRYDMRSLFGTPKLSPDAKILLQYLVLSKLATPDRGAARMLDPATLVDSVAMSEDNIIYAVDQLCTADLCVWGSKRKKFHVIMNTPWLRMFDADVELVKENRALQERIAELEAIKIRKPSAVEMRRLARKDASKRAVKTKKEKQKAAKAALKENHGSDSSVHLQEQNATSVEGADSVPWGPSNR